MLKIDYFFFIDFQSGREEVKNEMSQNSQKS